MPPFIFWDSRKKSEAEIIPLIFDLGIFAVLDKFTADADQKEEKGDGKDCISRNIYLNRRNKY